MILHEEAEDGNAMPDLSRSVAAVKLAVDNLVQVCYNVCYHSGFGLISLGYKTLKVAGGL